MDDKPITGNTAASYEIRPSAIEDLNRAAEALSGEPQIALLKSLLQQMLDVAENCDETGYADGVGFVDLDKLHGEVRAALKP